MPNSDACRQHRRGSPPRGWGRCVEASEVRRSICILSTNNYNITWVHPGDGVEDAFSNPAFSRDVLKRSPYKRYLLCIKSQCARFWQDLRDTGIKPVSYGDNFSDLVPFLEKIHPGQKVAAIWRGFSPGNNKITIIPSQIEAKIGNDDIFTYSNSTAEMYLVKQLEEKPLKWFGFDVSHHLTAHFPERWNDSEPNSNDFQGERKHFLSVDEKTIRGRNLIVLGSSACNRISAIILEGLHEQFVGEDVKVGTGRTPTPLKRIGEKALQLAPREFRPHDVTARLTDMKRDPTDDVFLTWGVVLRTHASISGDNSAANPPHVILAGGHSAEGTYACLCDEAQRELASALGNDILGDFLAVFHVKASADPRKKKGKRTAHQVLALRLVSVYYPRLSGGNSADCHKRDWVYLAHNRWRILVLHDCSTGERSKSTELGDILRKDEHVVEEKMCGENLVELDLKAFDLMVAYLKRSSPVRSEWFCGEFVDILKGSAGGTCHLPIVLATEDNEMNETMARLGKCKYLENVVVTSLKLRDIRDAIRFAGPPVEVELLRSVLEYLFPARIARPEPTPTTLQE